MRRSLLVVLGLVSIAALASTASAQPGQVPPSQGQGQGSWGAPAPGPGWGAPQPSLALLTPEERQLLLRGEISSGQHIGGGIVSMFLGFGIGHAVQGRYQEKGWIFTAGELASIGALVVFVTRCAEAHSDYGSDYQDSCERNAAWAIAGAVGLVGFRVWELIDVWAGPTHHNQRVRNVRMKVYGSPLPRYGLFAAPTSDGGGVAGLTLSF